MNDKKKSVCVFPETVPGDGILFPLVQVFAPVVYCQAVEEDEIPVELQSPFAKELIASGLGQIRVPSPLGEQRDRFLALIGDLKNRRDDYAAQLKNLSLSGIGGGGGLRKESKSSIIENLLQSKGMEERQLEEQEMLLWQARLLLKLGEIFDSEQITLQRELDKISELENGLFSELRKEKGQPFSLTKAISSASGQDDSLHRLRLKAWSRLYCLGTDLQDEIGCFVTTNQDAVDLLLENYGSLREGVVQRFLQLMLPLQPGERNLQSNLLELQQRGAQFFTGLDDIFADPTLGPDAQQEDFSAVDGAWAQLLETVYPAAECGRGRLHLYVFPRIDPRELFMATFGRDEEQLKQVQQQAGANYTIIGWLETLLP